MAKTGVQRTTEWRKKKGERMQAVIKDLLDDVDILVTRPKDGKQVVTFDMGRQTADALELVAAAQGTTLDKLMRGSITKNIREAARLKMVKDSHERQVKIAELREEQRKLQAEIAKYDAGHGK